MIYAFDVAYNDNNIAQAVGIGFERWDSEATSVTHREFIIGLEPYQPGEFYKRELPCIERLLQHIDIATATCFIIDGYVFLDDDEKPGLGAHLYHKIAGKVPVIGVAKSAYANNEKNVTQVLRGESASPLYVSAIGMELTDAAQKIKSMFGPYRMPALLSKLDQLTKR